MERLTEGGVGEINLLFFHLPPHIKLLEFFFALQVLKYWVICPR